MVCTLIDNRNDVKMVKTLEEPRTACRRVVSLQTQPYISKVGTFKGDVTRDDCNDDFKRNTALQHCCDIVSNGYNIVPALQRCVAPKIVVANRPVQHHLKILRRGLHQQ